MGNAAEWMFKSVWNVFDSTTSVDITSDEYMKVYNILFGVAVFVMLGFFLLQVIGGMIRREPAALTRALTGLAKSILGSFVAITLLALALEITDQLTIRIVNRSEERRVGKEGVHTWRSTWVTEYQKKKTH